MATVTLAEKPGPFSCKICEQPEWAPKAGPACTSCPAFGEAHYFPMSSGDPAPDVLFVAEAPVVSRLPQLVKRDRDDSPFHISFEDDGGKVLRATVLELLGRKGYRHLTARFVYGVKCAVETPSKAVITACQTPLRGELSKVYARREGAGKRGELVVVALGTKALASLGIAAESEEKSIGRDWHVSQGELHMHVFFSRSLKSIAAATGKQSALLHDLEQALRAATGTTIVKASREELATGYQFPRTNDEVRRLVRAIHDYSENGVPALQWSISGDTETNTLHPHKDGLLLTTFSFAWSGGQACAIPLFIPALHKPYRLDNGTEMPPFVAPDYDPQAAWEDVKWLLGSGKPIIMHNGKYDIKVVWKMGWDIQNWAWDVMYAEHALEEDKKGFYSLKKMAAQYLPRYAGYEDKLHDLLEKEEDGDRATAVIGEEKTVRVPEGVKLALDRLVGLKLVSGASFQAKGLEARLAALEASTTEDVAIRKLIKRLEVEADTSAALEQVRTDMRVLLAAKKAGEFRQSGNVEAKKAKERKGGFENIRIDELLFYAAIDADVTRQLAVMQVGRMRDEQKRIDEHRVFMDTELKFQKAGDRKYFVPRLCADPEPLRTLTKVHNIPRARALAEIEFKGTRIDRDYLQQGAIDLKTVASRTEAQIYELTGERFKLGSTKKLASFFFDSGVGYHHPWPEKAEALARQFPEEIKYASGRIMYRSHHYTLGGAEQTGENVLKSLVAKYQCPLANLLLSFKKANKATKDFNNIELLSREDGFIHPGYNINGTGTGRLSSSSGVRGIGFNQQNIAKGAIGALRDMAGQLVLGDDGKAIFPGVNCKRVFIPDDATYAFCNADAKGAEVSVYSAYSRDAALIEALIGGLDAHCFFGSKCLSPDAVGRDEAGNRLTGELRRLALAKAGIDDDHAWSYDDFLLGKDGKHPDKDYGKRLKVLRDNIKRLVFGLLYGAGVRKIADIAGIPLALAETIKKLLFDLFPSIPTFLDQTKWELKTFGFVETFDGRRRRFAIKNAPSSLRSQAERRCINFKVQGTNSDIVLKVLVAFNEVLKRDLGGRLLLTVHDSLGFQVPKKYAHQVPALMKEYGTDRIALDCPWMPVPYRWDVELGTSYGDLSPAAEYLAALPPELQGIQQDGYTEEEVFDALRDATDESSGRGRKKKKPGLPSA